MIWGVVPFVVLMMLAVLLLCFAPGIATWLPWKVMDAGVNWTKAWVVLAIAASALLVGAGLFRFRSQRRVPARP